MSSNKEEPSEELTPEERQQLEELNASFHSGFKKIIEKIISPLEWCWPATLLLLIVRYVLNKIGYYSLSFEMATIFIWGPFALLVGLVVLFVSIVYMLSLFGAWHKFMQTAASYFLLGFQKGKTDKVEKQDSEKNEDGEEKRDKYRHEFYTPPLPDIEDPNKKDKDDEAL